MHSLFYSWIFISSYGPVRSFWNSEFPDIKSRKSTPLLLLMKRSIVNPWSSQHLSPPSAAVYLACTGWHPALHVRSTHPCVYSCRLEELCTAQGCTVKGGDADGRPKTEGSLWNQAFGSMFYTWRFFDFKLMHSIFYTDFPVTCLHWLAHSLLKINLNFVKEYSDSLIMKHREIF